MSRKKKSCEHFYSKKGVDNEKGVTERGKEARKGWEGKIHATRTVH